MDMKGVTREEAVLFLLSLQEQIDLIVQHRRQEYDRSSGGFWEGRLVSYKVNFKFYVIEAFLKLGRF